MLGMALGIPAPLHCPPASRRFNFVPFRGFQVRSVGLSGFGCYSGWVQALTAFRTAPVVGALQSILPCMARSQDPWHPLSAPLTHHRQRKKRRCGKKRIMAAMCISACLHLSIHQSIHLSYLPTYLSIFLSISIHPSIHPSICLYVSVCLCLSIHLST